MKCPNCGSRLFMCYLYSAECDDEYRSYFNGKCDNCGKSYEWADIYKFTYTTSPEEIDENDQ